MRLRINEQDKSFLLSLAYATGIILFWKGVWEGVGEIPVFGKFLGNPFVALFIGLTILTLTGWIYRQFDAFSLRTNKLLDTLTNVIHDEAKGAEHFISYFDELTNKHHKVAVKHVRRLEQNHIVMVKEGHEVFIPIHRISSVQKGGRTIWRK